MNGECVVGLKHLIFVRRESFDPVAEWVNYRTYSLLEQFPPCDVLIMIEVVREQLMSEQESPSERPADRPGVFSGPQKSDTVAPRAPGSATRSLCEVRSSPHR